MIFKCLSSNWWGVRLMYNSHKLRNECPFVCLPEKSFGDAGLIECVRLTFKGCSQCNSGAGESGEHSDAGFEMLSGFNMLGSTLTQSQSACITNSCCRDWLIPVISLSSCLCQASVSSAAIGMLCWIMEKKWREDRKGLTKLQGRLQKCMKFLWSNWLTGQLATLSPPKRETFLL